LPSFSRSLVYRGEFLTLLQVAGSGLEWYYSRKGKKNGDVHLNGKCKETSKCVMKMVKCGEHRYYGSDEASEA